MSFFPRSTVSRFIVYGIINISLLAAIGADTLRKKLPRITLLLPILAGIIAIDLMSLTYQLSEQSFVLPHVVPAIQSAPSPIAMTLNRYDLNGTGTRTTRTYDAVLSGWGTFAYCSVLGPVPRVHTIVDQDHGDYITANQTSASFVLKSWSPNKVVVSVTNKETTRITLNTNYVKGWYANNKPADNDNDRVAITIPPSTNTVITFQYKAPGFILGLIITIVTSLATIVWFWKKTLL
jgi:hypothetical protein